VKLLVFQRAAVLLLLPVLLTVLLPVLLPVLLLHVLLLVFLLALLAALPMVLQVVLSAVLPVVLQWVPLSQEGIDLQGLMEKAWMKKCPVISSCPSL
jgi:hypothetical protein